MGKKGFILSFAVFCLLSGMIVPALCAPVNQHDHEWVWNVPVIPPEGGWGTEEGQSIRAALTWHEEEISDSGSGVGGHDIHFVYLDALDAASARTAPLSIDGRTAAVMSFSVPDVDRVLIDRLRGNGIPLFLAGGEEILIDLGGRPISNIFALDLFRDYRCEAFSLYAQKTLKPESHLAVAASRFTVDQEREAKICYAFLDKAGFMPMPFWVDASVRDSFFMMSQEIESAADGVVVSFLGSMGSREVWRNFMRLRSSWKLWNCAAPDTAYLSSRGMVFADQNLFLRERGGFSELKRRLWDTRVIKVTDIVAAGRAEALAEWLKRAINSLRPQPIDKLNRTALLQALERVRGIPFGSQKLDIAPELHRPAMRQVYIAEVRNRDFFMLDSVSAHGLAYVPGY